MSYYQFNRQEAMQKANKNCSKEKTVEYYLLNKEVIERKIGTKIWFVFFKMFKFTVFACFLRISFLNISKFFILNT